MKKLSGLASDYLEDIDILEEAKETLRKELAEWWKDLSDASSKEFDRIKESKLDDRVEKYEWTPEDNDQMHVGLLDTAEEEFPLRLDIKGPTTVKGRDYRLILKVTNQTELTNFKDNTELFHLVNEKAKEAGLKELDWNRTSLATHDVPVDPDDPEATKQLLIEAVNKIAHIVIAAYQLKAPKQTS